MPSTTTFRHLTTAIFLTLSILSCSGAPSYGVAPYYGPDDLVNGATAWWGLRAFGLDLVGTPIADIRCVTAAKTVTILSLTNGNFDVATLTAACPSDTYFISQLYDQTGNGFHLTQTTASQQPALQLNCIGSEPCMAFTSGSSQTLTLSSFPGVAQPMTLVGVAMTTQAAPDSTILGGDPTMNAAIGFSSSSSTLVGTMSSGTVLESTTLSLSTYHSLCGVFSSTVSVLYFDGNASSGDANVNGVGTSIALGSTGTGGYLQGQMVEAGVWNVPLSPAQASYLSGNANTFWNF